MTYFLYESWIKPKKALKRSRNAAYRVPDWYPFRRLSIDMANDEKFTISFNKIMSIIGEIFMIGWVTIVLIAWFTGE
jgi:hypothetical protein